MSKGKSKCQKINKKPSEPKLVIFSKSLLENIAYIIVILKRNTSEMRSYMKFYIANPMMTLSILSDFSNVLIFLLLWFAFIDWAQKTKKTAFSSCLQIFLNKKKRNKGCLKRTDVNYWHKYCTTWVRPESRLKRIFLNILNTLAINLIKPKRWHQWPMI